MISWVWDPLQYLFLNVRGAQITVSGDFYKLPRQENALILANHQSWTDFYAIHTLAQKKSMLTRCRYFAKNSLRHIPLFGWAMVLAGMVMLKRNWMTDRIALEKTFGAMKERKWPVWLITFAEGTRIKPTTLAESQEFSRKAGLPILTNVLIPRNKGFNACITALRGSHIRHVYDLTIAYYPMTIKPPTMLQIFCLKTISPFYKFHVHVRRYDIDELPRGTQELNAWLLDRWVEKDQYLEGLKRDWAEGIALK